MKMKMRIHHLLIHEEGEEEERATILGLELVEMVHIRHGRLRRLVNVPIVVSNNSSNSNTGRPIAEELQQEDELVSQTNWDSTVSTRECLSLAMGSFMEDTPNLILLGTHSRICSTNNNNSSSRASKAKANHRLSNNSNSHKSMHKRILQLHEHLNSLNMALNSIPNTSIIFCRPLPRLLVPLRCTQKICVI